MKHLRFLLPGVLALAAAAFGASSLMGVLSTSATAVDHDIAFKVVGGGGFNGDTTIRGGKQTTYVLHVASLSPYPEVLGAVLVIDPLPASCPAPNIRVPDQFDLTPGDDSDDTLFIDFDGDTIVEAIAFAKSIGEGANGGPIAAFTGGEVPKGTVVFQVRWADCGPGPGTAFDYKVTVDVCHSGDTGARGFFFPAGGPVSPDCLVTQAADGGTDPDQGNDAKISRMVNDTTH